MQFYCFDTPVVLSILATWWQYCLEETLDRVNNLIYPHH